MKSIATLVKLHPLPWGIGRTTPDAVEIEDANRGHVAWIKSAPFVDANLLALIIIDKVSHPQSDD